MRTWQKRKIILWNELTFLNQQKIILRSPFGLLLLFKHGKKELWPFQTQKLVYLRSWMEWKNLEIPKRKTKEEKMDKLTIGDTFDKWHRKVWITLLHSFYTFLYHCFVSTKNTFHSRNRIQLNPTLQHFISSNHKQTSS